MNNNMKAIKYSVSIVVGLAVLLFLVAPPIIGIYAKHQYSKMLTHLSKSSPQITVTITDYQFGWFHSSITTECDFHPLKTTGALSQKGNDQNKDYRITAYIDIQHGPIIFARQKDGSHKFHFAIAYANTRIPAFKGAGHAVWSFNNLIKSQFSSPNFQINTAYGVLNTTNFHSNLKFNFNISRLKFLMTADSAKFILILTGNKQPLSSQPLITLSKIKISGNEHRVNHINYGNQTSSVENMVISFANKEINFNKLYSNSSVALKNKTITFVTDHNIGHISKNNLKINGFKLDLMIDQLNTQGFNHFLLALPNSQNDNYYLLVPPAMKLIQSGFTVNLQQLLINTSAGPTTLSGTLKIPPTKKNNSLLHVPMMMTADFDFQVPQKWLRERLIAIIQVQQEYQKTLGHHYKSTAEETAADTIATWEQQEFLIPIDDYYKARIQYQKGHLIINGRVPTPNKK